MTIKLSMQSMETASEHRDFGYCFPGKVTYFSFILFDIQKI